MGLNDMRFKPVNHSAQELLEKIGFYSANRGYALDKKSGRCVRIHALIELDGTINTHEDWRSTGSDAHITTRTGRLDFFNEIFSQVDLGIKPDIKQRILNQYPGLKP